MTILKNFLWLAGTYACVMSWSLLYPATQAPAPIQCLTVLGLSAIALCIASGKGRPTRGGPLLRAVTFWAVLAIVSHWIFWLFSHPTLLEVSSEVIARPIALLLQISGLSLSSSDGLLYQYSNQAMIQNIRLGPAATGWVPMLALTAAFLIVRMFMAPQASRSGLLLAVVIGIATVTIRLRAVLGLCSVTPPELHPVLMKELFGAPWLNLGVFFAMWVLWLTYCLPRLSLDPSVAESSVASPKPVDPPTLDSAGPWEAIRSTFGLWILFLCGVAIPWSVSGSTHAPWKRPQSILVDDYYSKSWQPASAQYDRHSFGIDAAYTTSVLNGYLGFAVQDGGRVLVNRDSPFHTIVLDNYDVVVLKVPGRRLEPASRSALMKYISAGGGLLVIADHTDLIGHATFLNELLSEVGIQVRFDEVRGKLGGPNVDVTSTPWTRFQTGIRLDPSEYLTPSSLTVRPPARVLAVSADGYTLPGDYAKSSFFAEGDWTLESRMGMLPMAALADHGRGRIVVVSDGTWMSNFALGLPTHAEFLHQLVLVAAGTPGRPLGEEEGIRNPGIWSLPLLIALALGGVAAMKPGLVRLAPILGGSFVVLALALPLGVLAKNCSEQPFPRLGDRIKQSRALLLSDTEGRFPVTLGKHLDDPEKSYTALILMLMRSGLYPVWQGTAVPEDVLVAIDPVSSETVASLADHVRKGGRGILLGRKTPTRPIPGQLIAEYDKGVELLQVGAGSLLWLDRSVCNEIALGSGIQNPEGLQLTRYVRLFDSIEALIGRQVHVDAR